MTTLRCTLLADGPSDQVLLEVLRWLLAQHGYARVELYFHWATDLARRLALGKELYPADLYVVHRDAGREPHRQRLAEIDRALDGAAWSDRPVRLVPVRMTEAWLLIDQSALREASGNARGRNPLGGPDLSRLEELPDPKQTASQGGD